MSHARKNPWHQGDKTSSEQYDVVGGMGCWFGFILVVGCFGVLDFLVFFNYAISMESSVEGQALLFQFSKT